MAITVLTAALTYGMLTFSINFFEAYAKWRRWVVLLQVFAIVTLAISGFVEIAFRIPLIFSGITITPNGLVFYNYPLPLLAYFIMASAYVAFFPPVQTPIIQSLKPRNPPTPH